jgi:hypothetical protein
MEAEKTLNSKSNPEQNSNAEGITILNLKLYYKTIVIKTE